jgi:hypothetical protein
VVEVAVAVEDDSRDLLGEQLGADRLADLAGLGLLVLALAGGLDRHLEVGRGGQDGAGGVVDGLHVDVLGRAEHRQARTLGGAGDVLADGDLAAEPLADAFVGVLDVTSHDSSPSVGAAGRRRGGTALP